MAVRTASPLVAILFTSLGAVLSCSAPGEGNDISVPEFQGASPGAGLPGAAGPGAAPLATSPSGAPEAIDNARESVPVASSGANTGAANGASAAANGAGGSASVEPAAAPSGNGGSAMSSAAGNGNTPVGDGQGEPPAVEPSPPAANDPPANPPPANDPPPVNPGPVGSGCAPGAAFFCEDFETLNVGTAQATSTWRPEGNVTIDSEMALGTRSVHFQANSSVGSRIVVTPFAPPNNSFFGRINLFVQQLPTGPNFAHFVFVEATGSSGEQVRPLGGQFVQPPFARVAGNYWGVGSDGGNTSDWTNWRDTVPTEAGRWTCVEWQMQAANGAIDVWLDSVEKPELSVSVNDHGGNQAAPFVFPTFDSIRLGWIVFQGNTTPSPINVWMDDIVLSTERVGCN